MTYREKLKKNMRVAAAEQDTTLTGIAVALGHDYQFLARRLRGEAKISLDDLLAWAGVLNIPLEQLIKGIDQNGEDKEVSDKEGVAA